MGAMPAPVVCCLGYPTLWILRPPPARGCLVFPSDQRQTEAWPRCPGALEEGPKGPRPGTTSPSAPATRETGRLRGPAGGHGAGWGSVDLRPRDCSRLGPSWGAGGSCVSWFRFLPAAGRGRGGGGPAAGDHKPGWVGSECGKSGSLAVPVRSGVRMPQDGCPARGPSLGPAAGRQASGAQGWSPVGAVVGLPIPAPPARKPRDQGLGGFSRGLGVAAVSQGALGALFGAERCGFSP